MVAWTRFPVPEFDYEPLRGMNAQPVKPIEQGEGDALIAKLKAGDQSVCGGYALLPSAALLEKLKITGEHAYAVMCLLPPKPIHVLGRSWAWCIQSAWILDSLNPASANILHHWKTTRPMSTRLGPDDGVTLDAQVCYILTGNKYADHWIGNRTVIDDKADVGADRKGFRILGGSDPKLNDFHHTCITFDWPA